MEPTKFDYWLHQNITMRWYAWLCKHNYHRIVWESAEGYSHCQCGEAILNRDEDLANRLTEMSINQEINP